MAGESTVCLARAQALFSESSWGQGCPGARMQLLVPEMIRRPRVVCTWPCPEFPQLEGREKGTEYWERRCRRELGYIPAVSLVVGL